MKTTLLLTLIATAMLGVGCAKNDKAGGQGAAAPILPPTIPGAPDYLGNTYTGDQWSVGATGKLHPVSTDLFNEFVASHPVEPKDVQLNINFVKVDGRDTYAGEVRLRYIHNGQTFEPTFKTGTGRTWDGREEYMYNKFFMWQGFEAFHAFLEDQYGAIVLVIDQDNDLGDGAGATEVSGSIWFKNHRKSFAPPPEVKCWFVTYSSFGTSPYDCRTFGVNGQIVTTSALYPGDGYKKLGSFKNINKIKAFNLIQ